MHYFEIYERHLAKFRGQSPRLMEIGIYSGGSLPMWQQYFGPGTSIVGVDIEPACRAYQAPGIEVLIGDQADKLFWEDVKKASPPLDIVIDDGGHLPHQQIATLESLLPHMAPGGVYMCEDVHGVDHAFSDTVHGLASSLNAMTDVRGDMHDPERRVVVKPTAAQSAIKSVAFYPYVVVIEMREAALTELRAPKHGTQWEPFLK